MTIEYDVSDHISTEITEGTFKTQNDPQHPLYYVETKAYDAATGSWLNVGIPNGKWEWDAATAMYVEID